jgi:hypothetical protein
MQKLYIYVSKEVRIRCYFSKPKGIREQKDWETAMMETYFVLVTPGEICPEDHPLPNCDTV